MISRPVVVDTDVASALIFEKGPWERYRDALDTAEPVFTFAVVGELRAFGVAMRFGDRRRRLIEEKIAENAVLRSSDDAIDIYARLHAKLTGHLHRGGVNDMWTAACALAHDPPLPVLTGDLKDFVPIAAMSGLELLGAA